ncbi:Uncharacterised protein [Vibrio cholerae]|nr:Uncharacterised protein [Vibrio cholerae]
MSELSGFRISSCCTATPLRVTLAGSRTTATTSCPRIFASAAKWLPIQPDAPRIATFIFYLPLESI